MIQSNNSTDPDDFLKCKMIAANCNTLLNGADYSNTYSCLAYVSSNLIHIYDTKTMKTYLTLKAHNERANVVRWMDSYKIRNDLIELISCSADGSINHWVNHGKNKSPFDYNSWKLEKTYFGSDKTQPINCLNVLFVSYIEKYFVTFSAGGNLDLFYFDVDLNEYKMFHSIPFKKKLQDAICLTVLNDNYLLLLTGGYDSVIHIYTVKRIKEIYKNILDGKEFSPCSHKISMHGHLNNIREISAICPELDDTKELYFASSSQDTYIRIWHVVELNSNEIRSMADTINQKGSLSIFDEYKSKTSYVIKTDKDEYYNIILDSVLSGHEESVSSIKWGYLDGKAVLISSSFDFTIGIWKFDQKFNIWNKEITLGEMVGNKHAFYYANFIENCNTILAYTYNGSFYLWRYNEAENQYKSCPVIHGHFGHVSDLDWDSSKSFLITTSRDQTTRIFANWKANDSWHEINRPQIHGYDIHTICALSENKYDNVVCKIVSGADEKIIRIFNAPFNIVKFLQELSGINLNFKKDKDNSYYEKCKTINNIDVDYSNIEGSKQALGLMTKEVKVEMKEGAEDEENFDFSNFNPDEMLTNKATDSYIAKYDYSLPPDEDFLTNNTLWPENTKLYGHGYELISVASSHDGTIIASGCKASSEKNSKLFLWSRENKNLICKLDGHVLTITQIEFSHDDQFILTVSRDRSVCIYQKSNDAKSPYILVQKERDTHERIIWGCSWSHDDNLIVTGSRDKTIKVWKRTEVNDNKLFKDIIVHEFKESVTSVNIVPHKFNDYYIVIVGQEDGNIEFYSINTSEPKLSKIIKVHPFLLHGLTVTRIKSIVDNNHTLRIATSSEDHSVRIFEISLASLEKKLLI